MEENCLTKKIILSVLKNSESHLTAWGVQSVGLFGSFVRGDATPESDIDILVEFDAEQKSYDNFIDTCYFLEDLFQRKVELVTEESLSPYIKPYILKEVQYVSFAS